MIGGGAEIKINFPVVDISMGCVADQCEVYNGFSVDVMSDRFKSWDGTNITDSQSSDRKNVINSVSSFVVTSRPPCRVPSIEVSADNVYGT